MTLTVKDFMSTEVKTLAAETTLLEALQFLREHKVRHIPVLDGQELVGVVTDRDIKRATPSALLSGQREVWEKIVNETRLGRVMSGQPITCAPQTTIQQALETFVEERIGCLPVVEAGKLTGIVTASDLFRAALKLLS